MDQFDDHKKEVLHDFATTRERDDHGHFIPRPHTVIPETGPAPQPVHPLIQSLFPHGVSVDHKTTDDTLLDVHLGNPLRRITAILEEMKKQKAFSFNIRGSLGLAGIVVVLGTFGFFGGTKALCSKGVQSHIGTIKQLETVDSAHRIPVLSTLTDALTILQGKSLANKDTKRIVLVKQDSSVLHIPATSFLTPGTYAERTVIVTGDFDSCSNTVTLDDARGIQAY